ncbi:MAG: hypothetical protein ACR2RE_18255 [Geminicoccaceae bacterium]
MNDGSRGHTLAYLRRLDEKLERVLEWQGKANKRFTALDQGLTSLRSDNVAISRTLGTVHERIDTLEARLDRIERRLDLADAPAE